MALAATFLSGAKSRLLPASIPFRFFGAAAIFHLLMWAGLLVAAEPAVAFEGGPGPALAVVHLLTLGVLATTAIGASVQLLPVATRRALAAQWPIKLVFWLLMAGITTLCAGMTAARPSAMIAGAALAATALIVYAGLLAVNLWRAGAMPVVAAYGWAALAALVLLAGAGLALAVDYRIGALRQHGAVALTHAILGGFGFMGLLALGFSHVLVPMFALAEAPPRRPAAAGFVLAVAAVATGAAGALAENTAILAAAALIGLSAAGFHLVLMQRVLANGMRKHLGLSFVLIRGSWLLLPLTLVIGLAALFGRAGAHGATLFGFMLFGGWLLTFLLGVLQRILPFLASMHVSRSGAAAPSVPGMAKSAALKIHAVCHGSALAVLATAIAVNSSELLRLGAATGLAGATAFTWFCGEVMLQLVRRT